MRRILPMLGIVLLPPVATAVPFQERVATEVVAVGATALSTFRALVKQQKNYREMGFESLDEIDRATLGDPLAVFFVRLDELGKYADGQDPGPLLHRRTQVMFPVLVGEAVRSSLTLGSGAKVWQPVAFGGPNKIRLLASTRAASSRNTKLTLAEYFAVEIPGLKLVFLGHRSPTGVLMLTPVLDNAAFKFKAGVTLPSAEVFAATRAAARSNRDLLG